MKLTIIPSLELRLSSETNNQSLCFDKLHAAHVQTGDALADYVLHRKFQLSHILVCLSLNQLNDVGELSEKLKDK
jgi:hypothetical protein